MDYKLGWCGWYQYSKNEQLQIVLPTWRPHQHWRFNHKTNYWCVVYFVFILCAGSCHRWWRIFLKNRNQTLWQCRCFNPFPTSCVSSMKTWVCTKYQFAFVLKWCDVPVAFVAVAGYEVWHSIAVSAGFSHQRRVGVWCWDTDRLNMW